MDRTYEVVQELTAGPTCRASQKIRFRTRRECKRAAKRLAKVYKRKFRVYLCPHCAGWHLSKQKPNPV